MMNTHLAPLDLSAPDVSVHRDGRRPVLRRIARRLLAISPKETSFDHRGFQCDDAAIRARLEGVALCFVRGYHAALECPLPELPARLDAEPVTARGWAYEGAAMALTILDAMTFQRQGYLRSFLAGPGDNHVYIVHVGAGWALARLPLSISGLLRRLHPVFGWLAVDGYGFHEGFFHAARSVARQEVPAKAQGYARRAFDQGLGRSLWFVNGADPGRIAATIGAFPEGRRPDLWSGVGLACAYAGGRSREAVEALQRAAAPWTPELAQGAVFAATARLRAGGPIADTELACQVLCGCGMEGAAAISDAAEAGLPADGAEPAFEVWRRRIQERFPRRLPS
jgi:hypothetical protein